MIPPYAKAYRGVNNFGPLTPGMNAVSLSVPNWLGNPVLFKFKYYVPHAYDPNVPNQAILMMHGSGERNGNGTSDNNNNNTSQMSQAVAADFVAKDNAGQYSSLPAIGIFPQVPLVDLVAAGLTHAQAVQWLDNFYLTFLSYMETIANISTVYLAGYSAGTYRAWDLAFFNPSKYSKILCMANGVDNSLIAGGAWTGSYSDPNILATNTMLAAALTTQKIRVFQSAVDGQIDYHFSENLSTAFGQSSWNNTPNTSNPPLFYYSELSQGTSHGDGWTIPCGDGVTLPDFYS